MTDSTAAEFPCDFPIKVMGRRDGDLRREAQSIVERHSGPLADERIRVRHSKDGNFVAVTFMIRADSRPQVDQIYRELTACKAVLMAL